MPIPSFFLALACFFCVVLCVQLNVWEAISQLHGVVHTVGHLATAATSKIATPSSRRLRASHDAVPRHAHKDDGFHQPSHMRSRQGFVAERSLQEIGATAYCRWSSTDMHFTSTFSSSTAFGVYADGPSTWWIVKSDYVQVQMYAQGVTGPTGPLLARGMVFSGKFLLGHELIIKKDVSFLQESGMSPTYEGSYDTILATKVFWDGVEMTQSFASGPVRVDIHSISDLTVTLPLNMELQLRTENTYLRGTLRMGALPGGQGGLCWEGHRAQGQAWRVPDEENLFFLPLLPTLGDCASQDYVQAEVACQATIGGNANPYADFLNICIFDECFKKTAVATTTTTTLAPVASYVVLTSGSCPIDRQVAKVDCLDAAKMVGAEASETQVRGSDAGANGRPQGCTLHRGGNVEWWGPSNNAPCGSLSYDCICKAA